MTNKLQNWPIGRWSCAFLRLTVTEPTVLLNAPIIPTALWIFKIQKSIQKVRKMHHNLFLTKYCWEPEQKSYRALNNSTISEQSVNFCLESKFLVGSIETILDLEWPKILLKYDHSQTFFINLLIFCLESKFKGFNETILDLKWPFWML